MLKQHHEGTAFSGPKCLIYRLPGAPLIALWSALLVSDIFYKLFSHTVIYSAIQDVLKEPVRVRTSSSKTGLLYRTTEDFFLLLLTFVAKNDRCRSVLS